MRGTQAKLPATLPTPAAARSALREAKGILASRRKVLEGLQEQAKLTKDSAAKLEAEREQAEADLLAAAPGSPEDLAADAKCGELERDIERAERDAEKNKTAIRVAQDELAQARSALAAARGDLRALREGRRSRG